MSKCNWLAASIGSAALAALSSAALADGGVEECYADGTYKAVIDTGTPGDGEVLRADCDGSVNLVFRNIPGLANLTMAERIAFAVEQCVLPNGPYERADLEGNDGSGDYRLDYVTFSLTTPNAPNANTDVTLGSAELTAQLGFDPGVDMAARVTTIQGGNNGGIYSVQDLYAGSPTQILDAPGIDWIMFLKSAGGGQQGTLVCDLNMWADDPTFFGVKQFPVDHGVNAAIGGWAAGPSGLMTDQNVADTCALVNGGFEEKTTRLLIGSSKNTPQDAVPRSVNISACLAAARYCDSREVPGAVNGCNPGGDSITDIESIGVGQGGAASTTVVNVGGAGRVYECTGPFCP